jgi:hypothetical protein
MHLHGLQIIATKKQESTLNKNNLISCTGKAENKTRKSQRKLAHSSWRGAENKK